MDLLSLALLCGPWVAPVTTLSVIDIESGGQPFAIHDNTDGRSYWPSSSAGAQRLAGGLIRAGHSVDLGLMQINYNTWFRSTRVRLDAAFDPCINISFGSTILSAAYARESSLRLPPAEALQRALSVYNSGDAKRALAYANRVLKGGRRVGPIVARAVKSP
jgi:type IV secretion system protein VirB1